MKVMNGVVNQIIFVFNDFLFLSSFLNTLLKAFPDGEYTNYAF